jgi:hypothetical protein
MSDFRTSTGSKEDLFIFSFFPSNSIIPTFYLKLNHKVKYESIPAVTTPLDTETQRQDIYTHKSVVCKIAIALGFFLLEQVSILQ